MDILYKLDLIGGVGVLFVPAIVLAILVGIPLGIHGLYRKRKEKKRQENQPKE